MDITTRVNELLSDGRAFCLATVIDSREPQVKAGLKFIVHTDNTMEGGLGTDPLNSQVLALAQIALREKKNRLVELPDGTRLFLNIFEPETKMIICGAGHIAIPLAHFARQVGFKVTVLDDRADFAHPSRFAGCEVIAEDFTTALREMPMNNSTYAVVITRGHVHDVDCLQEILKKQTAYLGLIGSRRRVQFVLQMLAEQGFPQDRLEQVFTPIGIPIGSESPEEIALSIMAELVCVRRKGFAQARAMRAAIGVDR